MRAIRGVTLLAFIGVCCAQTPDPQRLFEEAVSAQQKGDNAGAVERYREIVRLNPGTEAAWINMGIALVRLGQFDQAVESYQKALALEPGNQQTQFNLGLAWYKKGDFSSASRQFEQLQKTSPRDISLVTLLGECYLHLGDTDRVIALMSPLAASAAGAPDFLWVYGSALVAGGKLKEGADVLERLGQEANAADALTLAGDALLRSNLSGRALTDLEKAVRINPSFPGAYTKLGTALERNADYPAASDAYRKGIAQNPKDLAAFLGLGGVLYCLRDLPGARAALEQALRLDPSSVDARYRLALVEKADGHPEQAVADLESVVKVSPNWMAGHVELAALYFRLHRTQDGVRERQAVDRLAEAQRKAGPGQE